MAVVAVSQSHTEGKSHTLSMVCKMPQKGDCLRVLNAVVLHHKTIKRQIVMAENKKLSIIAFSTSASIASRAAFASNVWPRT